MRGATVILRDRPNELVNRVGVRDFGIEDPLPEPAGRTDRHGDVAQSFGGPQAVALLPRLLGKGDIVEHDEQVDLVRQIEPPRPGQERGLSNRHDVRAHVSPSRPHTTTSGIADHDAALGIVISEEQQLPAAQLSEMLEDQPGQLVCGVEHVQQSVFAGLPAIEPKSAGLFFLAASASPILRQARA